MPLPAASAELPVLIIRRDVTTTRCGGKNFSKNGMFWKEGRNLIF
jgi:hypothetical protein